MKLELHTYTNISACTFMGGNTIQKVTEVHEISNKRLPRLYIRFISYKMVLCIKLSKHIRLTLWGMTANHGADGGCLSPGEMDERRHPSILVNLNLNPLTTGVAFIRVFNFY